MPLRPWTNSGLNCRNPVSVWLCGLSKSILCLFNIYGSFLYLCFLRVFVQSFVFKKITWFLSAIFSKKLIAVNKHSFTRLLPSCAHFKAESTEAMWIKCPTLGHSLLMQPGFVPSITVSRNRYLTNMTNMLFWLIAGCAIYIQYIVLDFLVLRIESLTP